MKDNIFKFGEALLESGDLDPIYIMLDRSELDLNAKKKWCLVYWCFYHAGVASKVTEANNFWAEMYASHLYAPRGKERRHFRGDASAECILYLKQKYPNPVVP